MCSEIFACKCWPKKIPKHFSRFSKKNVGIIAFLIFCCGNAIKKPEKLVKFVSSVFWENEIVGWRG
mgnify:FL=1